MLNVPVCSRSSYVKVGSTDFEKCLFSLGNVEGSVNFHSSANIVASNFKCSRNFDTSVNNVISKDLFSDSNSESISSSIDEQLSVSESDSIKEYVLTESNRSESEYDTTTSPEFDSTDNDINLQFRGVKEGLSIYYTNADSLLFKMDKLKVRIQLISPDILIITEVYPKTGKSSDVTDAELYIDNYTCYRSNTSENNRGRSNTSENSRGVVIYIKDSF